MNKPSGFTLIELMIVISILSILFVSAFPNYQSTHIAHRLYSQAKELEGELWYMQKIAKSQKKKVKTSFSNAVDERVYRAEITVYTEEEGSETEKVIRSFPLRQGIDVATSPSSIYLNAEGKLQSEEGFFLTQATVELKNGNQTIKVLMDEMGRTEIIEE